MKLLSVSVEGFRSLAAVPDLQIGTPTLLTGHNDAGKTAILDAVCFLLNGATLSERDRTFDDSRRESETHDGSASAGEAVSGEGELQRRVVTTSVEGVFSLSDAESTALILPQTLRLRRISSGGNPAVYEYLTKVPTEARLRGYRGLRVDELTALIGELGLSAEGKTKAALIAALDTAAEGCAQLDAWLGATSALVKSLPRALRFEPSGTTDAESAIKIALSTAYTAHIAAEDLRDSLAELEDQLRAKLVDDAAAIRAHIMERCPDIGDVHVQPDVSFSAGLRGTDISVVSRQGEEVRLGEAGAGRARRVAFAVWEYTKEVMAGATELDVVLLYDEPDTHLDYGHQRDLMVLLREQCGLPNVRMLVATHSMNLIDGVDIADVVHVRHREHRTVIERLHDDTTVGKHLGNVAAALGLRNTVLLHERLFVGVEGVSEQSALPVLFRIATGRHLESSGIALWACRNNEGAMDFATFLVEHGRNVAFVVDHDSKRAARNVFSDDKLMLRGLSPNKHAIYIGDPNEFEEIFSDEQWARVGNAQWPRVDGGRWELSDIASLRSTRKFSAALLELFKVGSEVGPWRKQQLVTTLALGLGDASEVPAQLRDVFDELVARAT